MFCTNCGSQNPDGSRFCAACGSQLPIAAPVQPSFPPTGQPQIERPRAHPARKRSALPLIFAIVALLLLIAGGFTWKAVIAAREANLKQAPVAMLPDGSLNSKPVMQTSPGPNAGNLARSRELPSAPGRVCDYLRWVRDVVDPKKSDLGSRDVLRDLAGGADSLGIIAGDPEEGFDKAYQKVKDQSKGVRESADGLVALNRQFMARQPPEECEVFRNVYSRQLLGLKDHFEWLTKMASGESGFTGAVDFMRENSQREQNVTELIRQADKALQDVFDQYKFTDPVRFHILDPAPGGQGTPLQLPGNNINPLGGG